MRKLSLTAAAVLIGLSATAALAQTFRAPDGAVVAVYGGPTTDEWEASVASPSGEVEEMCDVSGPHGKALFTLYCDPDDAKRAEQMLRAKGGITFRGKFYAAVKAQSK
jgi:hypothetical protein